MKILLIGDPMSDVNYWCRPQKMSSEAVIPVLTYLREDVRPGGMLNVEANLKAMCLEVEAVPTSTLSLKKRLWANDQMICRWDRDGVPQRVDWQGLPPSDHIVISDYGKGDFTYHKRKMDGLVFVDTKNPMAYLNCDYVFPNRQEWEQQALQYSSKYIFRHVILKDGGNGCFVDGVHVPTEPILRADTVGAGDTFLAAFVRAKVDGWDDFEAARFANRAAHIACSRLGTAIVSYEEMKIFPPISGFLVRKEPKEHGTQQYIESYQGQAGGPEGRG